MTAFKSITEFISKKKNLINTVLLYALAVFGGLSIVLWNVSIADKVSIAVGALVISLLFLFNIKEFKTWQICAVLINMLSLTVTLVLNKGDGLGVVLVAYYIILSLIVHNKISFDRKAIDLSRYIICGAILLLFVTSTYRKSFEGNWIFIYDRLTGGYINNNSICILIVSLIFLLVILLKSYYEAKSKGSLILVGLITLIGIVFVYPFGGRISIASIALFFLFIMLRGVKINTSLYKTLCIALLIASLLLPILYIYMSSVVDNFEFMGKNFFTGREIVWRSSFEQIKNHPLFGSGTSLSIESSMQSTTQSAHNTLIGIWKNVGIIPMLSVIICFFRKRYQYIKLEDRATLALLIIMFTETFFMDSHFCFIFLVFMLRSHDEIEEPVPDSKFKVWLKKNIYFQRKESKKKAK